MCYIARIQDRARAIELRKAGFSYSQIRDDLKVSKSSLSLWLREIPLSDKRLRELRDYNQIRIEKSRETKRKKKEQRRDDVLTQVAADIDESKDPSFVSGFYLYWGEGTKTSEYSVSFTNTDPAMVRCFIQWIGLLGVSSDNLKLKLHIYSDQNAKVLKAFWSRQTGIPIKNFYKTYIKSSESGRKTYKGMHENGTCAIFYHNRDIYEYVLAGVKHLRKKHGLPG